MRPASAEDVEAARGRLPDLVVDRWRPGGNRRSFVALDGAQVVDHARGVDNDVHPGSRVLLAEVLDAHRGRGVATALLRAQVDVSHRPLRVKLRASDLAGRALARRLGGIAAQACPPWRYATTSALRAWAVQHRALVQAPTAHDAPELLDLEVRHYLDQHAGWSPAHEASLRETLAVDVHPGEGGFDPGHTTVLRVEGRIVAAALVWPHHPGPPVGGAEVSLICTHHGDPASRAGVEACLAGVVDRCDDDDVLLVDSHATEAVETAMMRDVPGPGDLPGDEWLAIVVLPAPGGLRAAAMPAGLLPDRARWIERDFITR